MSTRRGSKNPFVGGPSNTAPKGNIRVEQLSQDVASVNLDATQGGGWEVVSKKPKNRGAACNVNQRGILSSTSNNWGQPNVGHRSGMSGNNGTRKPTQRHDVGTNGTNGRGLAKSQPHNKPVESNFNAPATVVPPPLHHGWQWAARACSFPDGLGEGYGGENFGSDAGRRQHESEEEEEDDDDDDLFDDLSDGFDSDRSLQSHETLKKHKFFKPFFEDMEKLTVEQLNEPLRQWHCPACKNGPGAIDWYRLQPLMAHAKTKGSSRVKLHREFAEILDLELNGKGTSYIPSNETFGKWEGLHEAEYSRKIVWPPIIVVMNTHLEMDNNDEKWLGIGNQELLDYFSSYRAIKARSSYGPKGHRGMSILIFESSLEGYMEADSLHNHLADQGTGRSAWEKNKILFRPGGKRQLYGFMANKEDLDIFDKHSQDKTKFEIRSYQEMVLMPMRQTSEDNHQLVWLRNTNAKLTKQSKTLEESLALVSKKWRKSMEESRIVRQRTKLQHDQNKEEMDDQEQFFKDQFDAMQQVLEKSNKEISIVARSQEDSKLRREERAQFIPSQAKDNKEFEAERDKLVKVHEDKKAEMRCRHTEEETELEKEFESSLTRLMEKYALRSSEKSVPLPLKVIQ
ncbi:hypothetical protein AQUCO_00700169v1 [Aquilegia coerulea]|uniref:XS domain-containing protein n=1 Tax=Aquilegia coerulea TaxID=218851 RepID=A0A2G5EJ90_AQUCA|nr:hypothetical protein AQUCO_00700169v1 [Aquilegia coerulea]